MKNRDSSFSFTTLRYVHDITTGEFVNVGVALYSREARFLGAMCSHRYGRLSNMFLEVDGEHFRALMSFIEARFKSQSASLLEDTPIESSPKDIMEIATSILPKDDSSLQWSSPGGGVTDDPDTTLRHLFVRMVDRYTTKSYQHKTEADVWNVFRAELEKRALLSHLKPEVIKASRYEHTFKRTWRNGVLNVYEPISFDLAKADSIIEKANVWVGRVVSLRQSSEAFKVHFLVGAPNSPDLKAAFSRAEALLFNDVPGEKELVTEDKAAEFSNHFKHEVERHGLNP